MQKSDTGLGNDLGNYNTEPEEFEDAHLVAAAAETEKALNRWLEVATAFGVEAANGYEVLQKAQVTLLLLNEAGCAIQPNEAPELDVFWDAYKQHFGTEMRSLTSEEEAYLESRQQRLQSWVSGQQAVDLHRVRQSTSATPN